MSLKCSKCGSPLRYEKTQGIIVKLRCTVCFRRTKMLKTLYDQALKEIEKQKQIIKRLEQWRAKVV